MGRIEGYISEWLTDKIKTAEFDNTYSEIKWIKLRRIPNWFFCFHCYNAIKYEEAIEHFHKMEADAIFKKEELKNES